MADFATRTVCSGELRAVFTQTPEGWSPDWIYAGETPMLRFKDHEWLSIGHVHPRFASRVEELPDGGLRFAATSLYGQTPVAWTVALSPAAEGGFDLAVGFTPACDLELLEAFTALETPYDYDGRETVTTVIGMNPVSRWEGNRRITPPIFANPAWLYSRPQAARITGPCHAPFLCQTLTGAEHGIDRFITIVGDWQICHFHDVYANPTRNTPHDPNSLFRRVDERKGYKYLVGALNWSSAFVKDPNVLFAGGECHRQRLLIDVAAALPGGSLDAMLYRAWERAARIHFPADARVAAWDRTTARGISWQTATAWLRDVFCRAEPTDGLFRPAEGIRTYATGSRPKAGDDYSWDWWPQWAGLLHYRALLTGDQELDDACRRHDARFAAHNRMKEYARSHSIAHKVSSLPAMRWIAGAGKGGELHAAMRPAFEATCRFSAEENGQRRAFDHGAQASLAEALLLGARAYDDDAMRRQAMILLDEIAERLDGSFWEFNVGASGSLDHGGQIRSLGHGHAVLANLLAWEETGDDTYRQRAHRFARYLLAVSYACANGSRDPDFDFRGWCNGSNAGRDQIAEFPPWETQNGLLCLAALMPQQPLEDGFYDLLWYIARTGLAQFPAARTRKRLLDHDLRPIYVPRHQLASERDFYDNLPYLAYENPHDQTMLASYQGSDCLVGELVYGGGLARTDDDRLGVLVPRAATLDPRETHERLVHLWNPTAESIATTLTVNWPDGTTASQPIAIAPRERQAQTLQR